MDSEIFRSFGQLCLIFLPHTLCLLLGVADLCEACDVGVGGRVEYVEGLGIVVCPFLLCLAVCAALEEIVRPEADLLCLAWEFRTDEPVVGIDNVFFTCHSICFCAVEGCKRFLAALRGGAWPRVYYIVAAIAVWVEDGEREGGVLAAVIHLIVAEQAAADAFIAINHRPFADVACCPVGLVLEAIGDVACGSRCLPCQRVGVLCFGHSQVGGGEKVGRGQHHIGCCHVVVGHAIVVGGHLCPDGQLVAELYDSWLNVYRIAVGAKRGELAFHGLVDDLLIADSDLHFVAAHGLGAVVADRYVTHAALSFLYLCRHILKRYGSVNVLKVVDAYVVDIHFLFAAAIGIVEGEAKAHPSVACIVFDGILARRPCCETFHRLLVKEYAQAIVVFYEWLELARGGIRLKMENEGGVGIARDVDLA